MSATRALPRLAGRVALVAVTLAGGAALLVWKLGAGCQARQLLGLDFTVVPGGPGAALDIAATNLRLVGAALMAAWAIGRRPNLRQSLDAPLGLLLAFNMAAVGIALGAYGARLLEAVALHGPLELGAFAVAGGAYLAARAGELSITALAASSGLAVGLVAVGAVVETYAQLGANP